MLDDDNVSPSQTTSQPTETPAGQPAPTTAGRTRRRAASRPAGPPQSVDPTPATTPIDSEVAQAQPAPGSGAASGGPLVSDTRAEGALAPDTRVGGEPGSGTTTGGAEPDGGHETQSEKIPAKRARSRKSAAATRAADQPGRSQAVGPADLSTVGSVEALANPTQADVDRSAGESLEDGVAVGPADVSPTGGEDSPRRNAPRRSRKSTKAQTEVAPATADLAEPSSDDPTTAVPVDDDATARVPATDARPVALLFQAPNPVTSRARSSATEQPRGGDEAMSGTSQTADTDRHQDNLPADSEGSDDEGSDDAASGSASLGDDDGASNRRRRSRGGRNRRRPSADADKTSEDVADASPGDGQAETTSGTSQSRDDVDKEDRSDDDSGSSHRRRRRRRSGEGSADAADDPTPTVVRVREPRAKKETISSVEGSTRIEAKKQRRREGREAGRRRPPILSESEFLARRESVERVMAIRQRGEITQIGVLEDDVLVEHYVALESQSSLIGNVYLGRVQNVLPSMEAAFIDIGKGRNAVLYAGEVNWDLLGGSQQARRIENALKPGQTVLVQATKDPVGHKGARLTSQISLPGRYLVYVPGGGTSGISRKLPDTERNRLKTLLKDILPDSSGVIIRTAAEGASEEELTRDVTRLTARWEDIEKKVKNGQAPALLYGEPDTTIKVVRDLFTEDFARLVISGDDAWDMVDGYVQHVAPDLADRLERYDGGGDIFVDLRIEEQIAKALERKVWLPSGGSLVIDRTEAMTVVDVNTGKFIGSGGNLEQTVTKNNLEAAEEIVRQLRLRDIGGIIVVDFIDMVLENNRDLVLRRLVESLGRDRTRHQVAEVTSLGLVQMTRKRISTGLIEAFSHTCEVCQGRGVVIEQEPLEAGRADESNGHHSGSGSNSSRSSKRSSNRRRGAKSNGSDGPGVAGPDGAVADPPQATVSEAGEPDADPVLDEPEPSGLEGDGVPQSSEPDPVVTPV